MQRETKARRRVENEDPRVKYEHETSVLFVTVWVTVTVSKARRKQVPNAEQSLQYAIQLFFDKPRY